MKAGVQYRPSPTRSNLLHRSLLSITTSKQQTFSRKLTKGNDEFGSKKKFHFNSRSVQKKSLPGSTEISKSKSERRVTKGKTTEVCKI
jgi:hypothetical protein